MHANCLKKRPKKHQPQNTKTIKASHTCLIFELCQILKANLRDFPLFSSYMWHLLFDENSQCEAKICI